MGGIRVGSTSSRTVQFDLAYAPFGDTYATSGSADPAFTSQRQDTVAGLFDFPAREYSNEGRWTSPDPSGLASAHLSDPQTLNRYAYVRNNPLALTDPQGLDCTYGGSYENGAVGEYAADSGVSDDCPNDGPPLNTLLSDSSGNLNFYVADDDMIRNL